MRIFFNLKFYIGRTENLPIDSWPRPLPFLVLDTDIICPYFLVARMASPLHSTLYSCKHAPNLSQSGHRSVLGQCEDQYLLVMPLSLRQVLKNSTVQCSSNPPKFNSCNCHGYISIMRELCSILSLCQQHACMQRSLIA